MMAGFEVGDFPELAGFLVGLDTGVLDGFE